jgi:hypothetical protein
MPPATEFLHLNSNTRATSLHCPAYNVQYCNKAGFTPTNDQISMCIDFNFRFYDVINSWLICACSSVTWDLRSAFKSQQGYNERIHSRLYTNRVFENTVHASLKLSTLCLREENCHRSKTVAKLKFSFFSATTFRDSVTASSSRVDPVTRRHIPQLRLQLHGC